MFKCVGDLKVVGCDRPPEAANHVAKLRVTSSCGHSNDLVLHYITPHNGSSNKMVKLFDFYGETPIQSRNHLGSTAEKNIDAVPVKQKCIVPHLPGEGY